MHAQLAQFFQYQALYEGFQHKAFEWYLTRHVARFLQSLIKYAMIYQDRRRTNVRKSGET